MQSARPPAITARRLVQIYDGGAMPSAPDHFYLAHPVELDGAETEGGLASPVVDTTTLAVDVLWGVPQAGDILTAYAVGGRWVAERSGGTSSGHPCSGCSDIPNSLTLSGPACELPAPLTMTWHPQGPTGTGGPSWWAREGGGGGFGVYWIWTCVTTPTLTIEDTTPGGFPPCSAFGTISSCSPFAATATFTVVPVGGGYNCPLLGFDCGAGTFTFTLSA
jgi:hypothetical protein